MFAGTIHPEKLRLAFEPVDALVDQCRFHLDSDGITVSAVDSSNVGMVDVTFPSDSFDAYESRKQTIGVPIDRFMEIVSVFESQDEDLKLFLEEETQVLRMESAGLDYTLSLLDPDSLRKEPKLPELNLSASITMNGDELSRVIRACNMISDHIVFGVEDGEFVVRGDGDTDSVYQTLTEDDGVVESFSTDDSEISSLFSIEYLRDIERVIPGDLPVTLEIGDEFPVVISYKTAHGDAPVVYLVAPRITSD